MEQQPTLGRTIPNSPEAEKHFLGCALIDGADVLVKAINKDLKPSGFYNPAHRMAYERLLAMLGEGKPIDAASLHQELFSHKELEQVGGNAFFAEIGGTSTTVQAQYFIDKLKELDGLRTIIREATVLSEGCYNYQGGGLVDLLGKPLERLLSVANGSSEEEELTWPQLVVKARQCADEIIHHKGRPADRIIPYPWEKMNRLFCEPERGDLVIIAGNSSTGKSSLGRQIACHASMNGKKGYIDTLEVQPHKWVLQMAATLSRVGIRDLPYAPGDKQHDFKQCVSSLKDAGITISRKDRWLAQVVARCKALKMKHGLDYAMIDYGALLKDVATAKQSEQVAAIASVVTSLKEMAGNLDIVVYLLWQLNRNNATGGTYREPILADLKGAGDLEQAADICLLIHRPNENPLTSGEQKQSSNVSDVPKFYQQVLQSKGRDVGCGSLDFYFHRSIATFEIIEQNG